MASNFLNQPDTCHSLLSNRLSRLKNLNELKIITLFQINRTTKQKAGPPGLLPRFAPVRIKPRVAHFSFLL